MTDNTEKPYLPQQSDNQDTTQMRQILGVTKTDKMSKLRRVIEFLEMGMQRVRTKPDGLQQDPK